MSISNSGAVLRNVTISDSAATGAALYITAGVLRNSVVISTNNYACESINGTIRDSVCVSKSDGEAGVVINTGGPGTSTTTLRNVTAIGAGASNSFGILIYCDTSHVATINGKNVIARGTTDVRAATSTGATSTVNLDHSSFQSVSTGSGGTITDPSTNFNQTTAPLFANATADDYHQLAGSPTIDAGVADGLNGLTDFDGDARTLGAAPDIGADEFVPAIPVAPPTTTPDLPPNTKITKKPKRKTTKRRARFTFSSDDPAATFRCKLDRGKYKPCAATFSKRVKPGRHVLRAVAVDVWGNADATPAVFRWRVL